MIDLHHLHKMNKINHISAVWGGSCIQYISYSTLGGVPVWGGCVYEHLGTSILDGKSKSYWIHKIAYL